jgi:putative heme-binding domain-containing protein
MRQAFVCTVVLAFLIVAGLGQSQDQPDPYAQFIAQSKPLTPAEEGKQFQLPPGFEIQLVAAEPDIHKPMNIAFDDRGRLWVTDSVEYPYPVKKGVKARDTVKVLEDFGPDGKARKITTFADGLNIPIGVLPLKDSALVYSIPNIYQLTDTKGSGRADRREVFIGSIGVRDTHGMTSAFTWGFDGWIYACHGYANDSTLKGKDGQSITMNSGNTYRMRPDGSHVEQFTWGQVNPFGLTFDPLGNLYSADCHTKPIMMLLRGAYYDSFGKPHDGLGYAPEMMGDYPDSTAVAGIAYYAADHFPEKYRDCAYIGDVVTNCVNQFTLEWRGSSPWATKKDFLKSKDPWFRPVCIQLGPDGALYIADFYNRIIGHYEVPLDHPGRDRERGRIWRIVYRGEKVKPPAPLPDFTKKGVGSLFLDLDANNLTVRMMASNQLVDRARKNKAVPVLVRNLLANADTPHRWVHGLWVLERLSALDEDDLLSVAAKKTNRDTRVHAMRILSERSKLSAEQRKLVLAGLKDKDPFVQRCAADALGRHPAVENIRPLLDAHKLVPAKDTHLLHVVRMALRDQLRTPEAWKWVATLRFTNEQRDIADVALGLPTADAAHYLMGHIQPRPNAFTTEGLARFVYHIARHGNDTDRETVVTFAKDNEPGQMDRQIALFRSIERGAQERGTPLSKDAHEWGVRLAGKLLASTKSHELLAGIVLAGSLRLESAQQKLVDVAGSTKSPEDQRSAAVTSLSAIDGKKHTSLIGRIVSDAGGPLGLRVHAANTLARLNHKEALEELLRALPDAPAGLQNVIAAGLAGSQTGAEKLLAAVAVGKASARLLQERFVQVRLEASKVPDWKKRVDKLTEGLPKADQRLQDLFNRRREGFAKAKTDAALGAKVFEKNCANCHQIANKGSKIGPQLDGVGVRGVDRLLEDILDPNRNVDQAFRATTLVLKDGQTITGLLLKEEGEVLVLADDKGKEVRVPKKNVEEKSVSPLSPMPANLVDQIAEADFYHLLAYLLAQRAPSKGK